ncbi:hypothetical protein CARUB_v10028305mg [Capsella rubella]|uniref:Transmembrane protein n=1 Tax=Capsella rubella TaxID=81985 RepID=R0GUY5_9BRAS|nr:uncharacterized protein LOC17877012 [Capsella rubella]EOA14958.1 hypothetical protein CARUB_v10028305mg [Capsella rubella]
MEKKNVLVLCMIILVLVISSMMVERVDCRALRPKRDVKGHDQSSTTMEVKNSSTRQSTLGKSFAYRLASGPSRRGRGH